MRRRRAKETHHVIDLGGGAVEVSFYNDEVVRKLRLQPVSPVVAKIGGHISFRVTAIEYAGRMEEE